MLQSFFYVFCVSKDNFYRFQAVKIGKSILVLQILPLKMLITAAADTILFFIVKYFLDKIKLDISCKSSAWQMIHMIHMKYQALVYELKITLFSFFYSRLIHRLS